MYVHGELSTDKTLKTIFVLLAFDHITISCNYQHCRVVMMVILTLKWTRSETSRLPQWSMDPRCSRCETHLILWHLWSGFRLRPRWTSCSCAMGCWAGMDLRPPSDCSQLRASTHSRFCGLGHGMKCQWVGSGVAMRARLSAPGSQLVRKLNCVEACQQNTLRRQKDTPVTH